VSYPLATGVQKIRYKRPPSLEKFTDIIFIENGLVVFSLLSSDEPTSIFSQYHPTPPVKNIKYSALQAYLSFGAPPQLTGKFASVDDRD